MDVRNTRLLKGRLIADVRLWDEGGRAVTLQVVVNPAAPAFAPHLTALHTALRDHALDAVRTFTADHTPVVKP